MSRLRKRSTRIFLIFLLLLGYFFYQPTTTTTTIAATKVLSTRSQLSAAAVSTKATTSLTTLRGDASNKCLGGLDWFVKRRAALGPVPEPLLEMSSAQRAANARVLVITSDTRPLTPLWENRTYWGLATALNRHYARTHGYDFAFAHTFTSSLPAGANFDERDRACFHKGYSLWRVHNWCKVLTMWAATAGSFNAKTGQSLYDLIVYIDSDAIIQDVGADISEAWAPKMGQVVFGAPFCNAPLDAAAGGPLEGTTLAGCVPRKAEELDSLFLIFSDNVPNDPGNPNMGFYLMRNEPRTLSMLRDWWDFVDPIKGHLYATYAFHEQTAIYKLMTRTTNGTNWGRGVTVTNSRWAPDELAQLVRHINSEENRYGKSPRGMRVDKYQDHWLGRGLTFKDYEDYLTDTMEQCDAVMLDVLEIGQHIETYDAPRHNG